MAQNINAGLQAYYPFDGNLFDQSPNGYDLVVENGVVSYTPVQSNDMALVLNGSSRVVSVDHVDNSAFEQEAVSVWFKTASTSIDLQIIVQGAFMGFGVYIEPGTGHLMGFFDGSSAGAYISQNPVNDGEWHHVLIQTDGNTTFMYLDGVLDGSLNEPLLVGNGGADNKLYLGKSNQNAYPYTGAVNGLRIYDRTLTLCEIAELYNQGIDNLVARYPFNGTLADVAGSSYDMTVLQGVPGFGPFMVSGVNALELDGNTSLYSEPIDNSAYTRQALSVWLKTTDQSNTNLYKVVVQGAFMGFGLFIESGSGKLLGFMDGSIMNGYLSSMSLTDGQWHHIVLQSNGQTTTMYIDGVLDGQLNEPMYTGNGSLDNRIYVGKTNQGSYPFVGAIRELQLFDNVLNACEIADMANPTFALNTEESPVEAVPGIQVYPNPTDAVATIDLRTDEPATQVEIWDMQGRPVQLTGGYGATFSVDLTGLASGIYWAKVVTGKNTRYVRIVKK